MKTLHLALTAAAFFAGSVGAFAQTEKKVKPPLPEPPQKVSAAKPPAPPVPADAEIVEIRDQKATGLVKPIAPPPPPAEPPLPPPPPAKASVDR